MQHDNRAKRALVRQRLTFSVSCSREIKLPPDLRLALALLTAWLAMPKPTEWQGIGNQIDADVIFTWSDFEKAL